MTACENSDGSCCPEATSCVSDTCTSETPEEITTQVDGGAPGEDDESQVDGSAPENDESQVDGSAPENDESQVNGSAPENDESQVDEGASDGHPSQPPTGADLYADPKAMREHMYRMMQSIPNAPVSTQTDAINVMAGLLSIAQWNGAFTIALSAKAHECIQAFLPREKPSTN